VRGAVKSGVTQVRERTQENLDRLTRVREPRNPMRSPGSVCPAQGAGRLLKCVDELNREVKSFNDNAPKTLLAGHESMVRRARDDLSDLARELEESPARREAKLRNTRSPSQEDDPPTTAEPRKIPDPQPLPPTKCGRVASTFAIVHDARIKKHHRDPTFKYFAVIGMAQIKKPPSLAALFKINCAGQSMSDLKEKSRKPPKTSEIERASRRRYFVQALRAVQAGSTRCSGPKPGFLISSAPPSMKLGASSRA